MYLCRAILHDVATTHLGRVARVDHYYGRGSRDMLPRPGRISAQLYQDAQDGSTNHCLA
jgi:hypothetical protein